MPLNWEHPRWQGQKGADLFEKFCSDLLRSLGFKNVDWRKGHPDEGWDIEAECDAVHPGGSRHERWYVQCKRYSLSSGVPPSKIDTKRIEMLPAKPDCLLLVTNSYFLPKVKDWSKTVHPFRVELWDGNVLESLILRHARIVEEYFPEMAQRLMDDHIHLLEHMIRSSLQMLYSDLSYVEAIIYHKSDEISSDLSEALQQLYHARQEVDRQMTRFSLSYALDAHPIVQKQSELDIAPSLEHSVGHFSKIARYANIRIALKGPPRLLVKGDQSLLRILFDDVIDNAVKYAYSGTEVCVKYGLDAAAKQAKITVSNTGVGIPAEEISKVFEKYYRGYRASRHFVAGLGIGLTLCKRIAEEHGGSVSLQSQATKSQSSQQESAWLTCCTVCLPSKNRA